MSRFRALHGLMLLLVVAVLFGGGGANYGLLNFFVQFVALVVLALKQDEVIAFIRDTRWPVRLLVAATILLPVVQALPLPPSLWQALPGRDLVVQSMAAAGYEDRWLSLSIDMRRTWLAASGLIAPFVALALATRVAPEDRQTVFLTIVGLAALSFLAGAIQMASGHRVLSFYVERGGSELMGFFANRNSTGLFFVISLLSLVAVREAIAKSRTWKVFYLPAAAILALGVVLTQSRSSTVLLLFGLCFLAAGEFSRLRSLARKGGMAAVAAVFVGVAALAAIGLTNDKIGETLVRYDDMENLRWSIWADTLPAIGHYWPVGSGFGTFRETSEVFESLESVSALTAGRAHNDYLETALEGGVFSIVLLAGWLAVILASFIAATRARSSSASWRASACALALSVIALQSVIDYPLRNQALLCVAATLFGMLLSYARAARREPESRQGVE